MVDMPPLSQVSTGGLLAVFELMKVTRRQLTWALNQPRILDDDAAESVVDAAIAFVNGLETAALREFLARNDADPDDRVAATWARMTDEGFTPAQIMAKVCRYDVMQAAE